MGFFLALQVATRAESLYFTCAGWPTLKRAVSRDRKDGPAGGLHNRKDGPGARARETPAPAMPYASPCLVPLGLCKMSFTITFLGRLRADGKWEGKRILILTWIGLDLTRITNGSYRLLFHPGVVLSILTMFPSKSSGALEPYSEETTRSV